MGHQPIVEQKSRELHGGMDLLFVCRACYRVQSSPKSVVEIWRSAVSAMMTTIILPAFADLAACESAARRAAPARDARHRRSTPAPTDPSRCRRDCAFRAWRQHGPGRSWLNRDGSTSGGLPTSAVVSEWITLLASLSSGRFVAHRNAITSRPLIGTTQSVATDRVRASSPF